MKPRKLKKMTIHDELIFTAGFLQFLDDLEVIAKKSKETSNFIRNFLKNQGEKNDFKHTLERRGK